MGIDLDKELVVVAFLLFDGGYFFACRPEGVSTFTFDIVVKKLP